MSNKINGILKSAYVLLIALCATPQAHAGIPVVDGANLSQNIIAAYEAVAIEIASVAQMTKQIQEYATQLEQYEQQIVQYQNQVQNTLAPAFYIWDSANSTINNLVAAQDTLNYYAAKAGNMNAYLAKFKDASQYSSSPCYSGGLCSSADRAEIIEHDKLASETEKMANDALFKGISIQQENMGADARRLEQLQASASTADGQVKAIQYASQIASHQSNQLLQIRGLMLAQQSALAARNQTIIDKEASQKAAGAYSRSGTFTPSAPDHW